MESFLKYSCYKNSFTGKLDNLRLEMTKRVACLCATISNVLKRCFQINQLVNTNVGGPNIMLGHLAHATGS